MLGIIQTIGYIMVLLLCSFAITIIYYCFRGGLPDSYPSAIVGRVRKWGRSRSIGGRILDRWAWGYNGLAVLWIALRQRHRLWRLIELTEATPPVADAKRFGDSGKAITLLEGMIVVSHLFSAENEEGKALYVRRPFEFLEHDWKELIGFKRREL